MSHSDVKQRFISQQSTDRSAVSVCKQASVQDQNPSLPLLLLICISSSVTITDWIKETNKRQLFHQNLSHEKAQEKLSLMFGLLTIDSADVFPCKLCVVTNKIRLLYPYTLALSRTALLKTQTELLPQLVWRPGSFIFLLVVANLWAMVQL